MGISSRGPSPVGELWNGYGYPFNSAHQYAGMA